MVPPEAIKEPPPVLWLWLWLLAWWASWSWPNPLAFATTPPTQRLRASPSRELLKLTAAPGWPNVPLMVTCAGRGTSVRTMGSRC